MTRTSDITLARRADDLTPSWFDQVLRPSGILGDSVVRSVTTSEAGTGQMSVVLRADLAYDRPPGGAPPSFFVKMAPAEDLVRQTGLAMGFYEAEVRFYNEIAPTVDVAVPECYLAGIDLGTGFFTIVMPAVPDTAPGDMLADGTADDAALALEQVVALQAPRWGDPGLRSTTWLQPTGWLEFSKSFPASLEPFLDRFGAELTDTEIRFCERVMPHAVTWMLAWTDLAVLQHGDFRPDNTLFTTHPDGSRTVMLFDWQAARIGPPPLDAGHWIGGSIAVPNRRRHEEDLVREYHARLRTAGVDSYSWDDCWEDYRRTALFGLYAYVGAYPHLKHSERGDALFLSAFRRFSAQAIENESDRFLPP
jgi:hypothetical protein